VQCSISAVVLAVDVRSMLKQHSGKSDVIRCCYIMQRSASMTVLGIDSTAGPDAEIAK